MLVWITVLFTVIGYQPNAAARETNILDQYRGESSHNHECKYSLLETTEGGEETGLQVLVVGPESIGNFSIRLNPNQLPLSENVTIDVKGGGRISYAEGELVYEIVDETRYFTDQIINIKIEVGPDLTNPVRFEAHVYEQVWFFWKDSQPIKSLICAF